MRHLIATLLIAATPALGLAQSTVGNGSATDLNKPTVLLVDQLLHMQGQADVVGTPQVMPLWSTPDGRILAMVAMGGSGVPALPRAPQIGSAVDWQWVDVTNFVSAGLLMRANANWTAQVSFDRGISYAPAYVLPAMLCSSQDGSPSPPAACATSNPTARYGAFHLGADWTVNDAVDVDLSYGLSWLRRDNSILPQTNLQPAWDLLSGSGTGVMPALIIPGAELANIQNSGVSALGHWRLNDAETLNLGASLGHIQLTGVGNVPLVNFNQASVGVGLRYGSFSGMVIGRVLGPADSITGNQRWSGLDLGISWRTPWQGELSVGAQNVWSSGTLPNLADPAATREIDSNQARVPYVQYHQDL
jgi:hypothetical protein